LPTAPLNVILPAPAFTNKLSLFAVVPSRFLLKVTLPLLGVPDVVRVIVGLLRTTGDSKVILPPLPAAFFEVFILPLRIIFSVPELTVKFPPVPPSIECESRVPVVMLPPTVERAIAPPFPRPEKEVTLPAVVSIAPVPPVIERLIFPDVPASEEKELRLPVVMLPPAVERAIDPPFPRPEKEPISPAIVSIAPVPPVIERLIFPPPASAEKEFRIPVVMLPPAVEMAIAPPFPVSLEKEWRFPAVVSIAPVPPVIERLIFPPSASEKEFRRPVVMLPPAVERAIAPPFPALE
jgi:hypothetical protein